MRIVYDDATATTAISALATFMTWQLDIQSIIREENWIMRVQRAELKKQLSSFFARHNLKIGDTVKHAYDIGNNCQYPVHYETETELQQCCSININVDPFGIGYVSLEDYNGKRISGLYKLTRFGATIVGISQQNN